MRPGTGSCSYCEQQGGVDADTNGEGPKAALSLLRQLLLQHVENDPTSEKCQKHRPGHLGHLAHHTNDPAKQERSGEYPSGKAVVGVIARAARIHELGQKVRSLARRVILLNAESFRVLPTDVDPSMSGAPTEAFFQIPPEQLRRAMVEVAPRITPHLRKMKRVERAIAAFHAWTAPSSGTGGSGLPRGWRPPPREEWVAVLENVPLEIFASSAGMQYYFASLLQTLLAGTPQVLVEIPREEQIILLTVRDLASWLEFQQRGRDEAMATEPTV